MGHLPPARRRLATRQRCPRIAGDRARHGGSGRRSRVEVPIAVVHGSRPGPRVAVTAGIHGAEYVSIAALPRSFSTSIPRRYGLARRRADREPSRIRRAGHLRQPARRTQPEPRVPGRPAGTASQRLAHWLTTEVIAGSDAFVDMHCGDMNEALVSFTGIEETGDAAVDARRASSPTPTDCATCSSGRRPGTTTTAAAASLGIPAVLAEVGGQGRWPGGCRSARRGVPPPAAGGRG